MDRLLLSTAPLTRSSSATTDPSLAPLRLDSAFIASRTNARVETPPTVLNALGPVTPDDHAGANHPFASTGGVPAAPRRQRTRREPRFRPTPSARQDSGLKFSRRTSSSAATGRHGAESSDKSMSASSPCLHAASLLAAPRIEQSGRFSNLPLTTPVSSAQGHQAPDLSKPLSRKLLHALEISATEPASENELGSKSISESAEDKSMAWLAQCNKALQGEDNPFSTPSSTSMSVSTDALLSPWAPDQLGSSQMTAATVPSSPPPSTFAADSVLVSPASNTRSKARRAAAAAELPGKRRKLSRCDRLSAGDRASLFDGLSYLPSLCLRRTPSNGLQADTDSARHPSQRYSRSSLPWQLRSSQRSNAARALAQPAFAASSPPPGSTSSAAASTRSSGSVPKMQYDLRGRSLQYAPSLLGLGICGIPTSSVAAYAATSPTTPFNRTLFGPKSSNNSNCCVNDGADHSARTGRERASSSASHVTTRSHRRRGDQSSAQPMSRADSASSSPSQPWSQSMAGSGSRSRIGTPFSAAGSCGGGASDYFGDAWRQGPTTRRVC